MKHHYWEPPIPAYLFLGGLAGGILFLAAIFNTFVVPGVTEIFLMPSIVAFICICIGLLLLVVDLGQPGVFWRVFWTPTSIIKWGAVFLTVATIFSMLFIIGYLDVLLPVFAPLSALLKPACGLFLNICGFFGLCIMMYTGIMISTLKAHAFWATPALPVLFTVSAISTGCAAIALSLAGGVTDLHMLEEALHVHHLIHIIDIILVIAEFIILMTMILSFLGYGNQTATRAAKRLVTGKYAVYFWGLMIACGLVIPFILYVATTGIASEVVAPILVLIGGCTLRFLTLYSDDRAPIPGEEKYMTRLPKADALFLHKWHGKENLF